MLKKNCTILICPLTTRVGGGVKVLEDASVQNSSFSFGASSGSSLTNTAHTYIKLKESCLWSDPRSTFPP